ncbi:MAG TPA: peptidylprolyl isomerase [Pyrinomonadaceae bacterium]|nr:peptidylprolyl isomerase [Pyrinomonadaceae bacterium]
MFATKLIHARAFAASVCLALALSAAGCGGDQKLAEKTFDDEDVGAPVKRGVKPEADAEAAVIETDYGRIVVELYPNLAPQMVERFKTLARQKFYDGTSIHRIDPELGIIQGGDPNSRDAVPENDGTGSSGLPNLPAEFSDVPYDRGIVGAARAQDVNSANCQFFVTLKRQPAFDNRYTVFGRVIEGIANADVIAGDKVVEGTSRPAVKIMVKSVTLAPRANFK